MLGTLRNIVQNINTAADFSEALRILVKQVRDALATDVCSVFLIDKKKQQYVLSATSGLEEGAIGRLRFSLDVGLIGQVGQKEEPINLDNALENEHFVHSPLINETQLNAFLGVPIIHNRQLLGVLGVQREGTHCYDEAEEAFLVTISAQLAGVIAHAEATGNLSKIFDGPKRRKNKTDKILNGIGCSPGVGIGTSIVVFERADLNAVPERNADDIDTEIKLLNEALEAARQEIRELKARTLNILPAAELELFDAYLKILAADSLGKEISEEIYQGQWAQGALRKVIDRHVNQFTNMQDDYLKERADDFRDLGKRILAHLQAKQPIIHEYPENTILIGEQLTASIIAEVPEGKLAGIVSGSGSQNSHLAIVARALGVPSVLGVKGMDVTTIGKEEIIVDGYYGQIYVNPTRKLRKEYLSLIKEEEELQTNLQQLRDLPAQTPDGYQISLFINTGMGENNSVSLSVGAQGVGLYRTEMAFMSRDCFPTEEEQRVIYRQLLKAFAPRPVIMRTLDIGGDKPLPYFPVNESNPFLGWRGIRITLDHPEVFSVQLRAMLSANEGLENLRILLPMITDINEVDDSLRLINKAYQELLANGFDIAIPPIGAMIEVPSAVYLARSIARRVDFLSIGSNDLTQYILAVDRNNAHVASLYDALHPAVLHALHHIVDSARSEGKQISLCGEMAGDPAAVIPLLAMGMDALSMNSTSLLRTKWVIRNISRNRARELFQEIMAMEHPMMIRYHLEQALEEAGLGGLVRAGK